MNIEQIAQVCHEINRAYCMSIGDQSQATWELAPQWQKDSAINGVIFHLSHPDASASASHESWMQQKINDGWKYGDLKDETLKIHPCIVPFEQLPPAQQAKDWLFRQTVHSLSKYLTTETSTTNEQPQKKEASEIISILKNELALNAEVGRQGVVCNEKHIVLKPEALRKLADATTGRQVELDRDSAEIRMLIR